MRILNWAQINGAPGTAEVAQQLLAKAMAPVVSAAPFPLAG